VTVGAVKSTRCLKMHNSKLATLLQYLMPSLLCEECVPEDLAMNNTKFSVDINVTYWRMWFHAQPKPM
jgi:hypothetical protein